jgi:hypothetical protein
MSEEKLSSKQMTGVFKTAVENLTRYYPAHVVGVYLRNRRKVFEVICKILDDKPEQHIHQLLFVQRFNEMVERRRSGGRGGGVAETRRVSFLRPDYKMPVGLRLNAARVRDLPVPVTMIRRGTEGRVFHDRMGNQSN